MTVLKILWATVLKQNRCTPYLAIDFTLLIVVRDWVAKLLSHFLVVEPFTPVWKTSTLLLNPESSISPSNKSIPALCLRLSVVVLLSKLGWNFKIHFFFFFS